MTPPPSSAIIEIRGVSKRFGDVIVAVDDVSLAVREGEFFALLGPSGCGKTTLLRILAGFEIPSEGGVFIDGESMDGIPPNRRPVNMVFQSYAVFPHMAVFDNVAYGLRVGGGNLTKDEIARRVGEALDLARLSGFEKRRPEQLSGGQQQRVALARALIKRPRVLLLDEPLSALDAKLREAMRLELVNLQHMVGITFVIVTHDQDEALSMADRIAVMEKGKVRQVAPPLSLYEFPNCRFVADFIGKMNMFDGEIKKSGGDSILISAKGVGEFSAPKTIAPDNFQGKAGVAVRPEKVRMSKEKPEGEKIALAAKVDNIAYHGSESRVFAMTDSGLTIMAASQNVRRDSPPPSLGERLWISWTAEDTLILPD